MCGLCIDPCECVTLLFAAAHTFCLKVITIQISLRALFHFYKSEAIVCDYQISLLHHKKDPTKHELYQPISQRRSTSNLILVEQVSWHLNKGTQHSFTYTQFGHKIIWQSQQNHNKAGKKLENKIEPLKRDLDTKNKTNQVKSKTNQKKLKQTKSILYCTIPATGTYSPIQPSTKRYYCPIMCGSKCYFT